MLSKDTNPTLTVEENGVGQGLVATSRGNIAVRGETGSIANELAGVMGVAGWTNTMLPRRLRRRLWQERQRPRVAGVTDKRFGVYAQSGSAKGYAVVGSAAVWHTPGRWGQLRHGGLWRLRTSGGSYPGIYGASTSTGPPGCRATAAAAPPGSDISTQRHGWRRLRPGRQRCSTCRRQRRGRHLTTNKVAYTSARTHYFTVPGNVFQPRHSGCCTTTAPTRGGGGACITSGSGAPRELWAQAHLPDGATVTESRAFFRDNTTATNSLTVCLAKLNVVVRWLHLHGGRLRRWRPSPACTASRTSPSLARCSTTRPTVTPSTPTLPRRTAAVMLMGARVTYTILRGGIACFITAWRDDGEEETMVPPDPPGHPAAAAAVAAGAALAQVSANYDLSWHLLSGGGGSRSSGSYRVDDSLGQWPGNPTASAGYRVDPGFWPGVSGGGGALPTPTPTATPGPPRRPAATPTRPTTPAARPRRSAPTASVQDHNFLRRRRL